MQGSRPTDELFDIRAEIARLKLREAALSQVSLAAQAGQIQPRSRPGWPIHREPACPGHASIGPPIGPPIGNAISRSSPSWIAV